MRYQDGTTWNGATTRGVVQSDYGTAVFVGDPVVMIAAGGSTIPTTTSSPSESDVMDGTYPQFNVATAGSTNEIWGVVTSIEPNRSDLSLKHIKASTGGTVNVARATSDLVFQIGEDTTSDALTLLDIGSAVDLAAGAGNATTGYSGWVIDSDSHATALQAYLVGLANIPGNSDYVDHATLAANTIWEVTIQAIQHAINPAGTGV